LRPGRQRLTNACKDYAHGEVEHVQISSCPRRIRDFLCHEKECPCPDGKLELNKYDPVVRKHVPFKEAKIK